MTQPIATNDGEGAVPERRRRARPHSGPIPVFRAPLPWRRATLVAAPLGMLAADLAALATAAGLVSAVRTALIGPMALPFALVPMALVWMAIRYHRRLYPAYGFAGPERLRRGAISSLTALLVHSTLLFAFQITTTSRLMALGIWLVVIPLSWAARALVRRALLQARLWGYPVAVVGSGDKERQAIRAMRAHCTLGLIPVAAFDDRPELHGTLLDGVPVLGPISAASRWRPPYPVRHLMLALPRGEFDGRGVVSLARRFSRRFPTVLLFPDLYGLSNLWVRTRPVGSYLALEIRHDRFARENLLVKRALDLAIGLPAFLVALPAIAVAALLVKLRSPGPAFYAQVREGLDGQPVKVWKIRTMVPDAERRLEEHLAADPAAREEWDRTMKLVRDPRIIPGVGRFLRRSSIDELPQLWSVLVGSLSLVGPRPFPDYHLARFGREFRELRRQVPPGVTGLTQVDHRSDSDLGMQEVADTYYINNWSIWLDLWILLRTVGTVLSGRGAC